MGIQERGGRLVVKCDHCPEFHVHDGRRVNEAKITAKQEGFVIVRTSRNGAHDIDIRCPRCHARYYPSPKES